MNGKGPPRLCEAAEPGLRSQDHFRPEDPHIFTREALVAIEDLTEQRWHTPHVTRVDSITNHSHREGREDELIVEPLVDDASSLGDDDLERIRRIALGTIERSRK